MTIQEIYFNYKIMPVLQRHQLRVAGVAKIICEHFKAEIDTQSVVLACLFHDMGNIIKSKLDLYPQYLEPEGLEYWERVKADYIERYGSDEHTATRKIVQEINLPERAIVCLQQIGFSNLENTEKNNSFENKIAAYADMRVGIHGVLSMEDRVAEGRKRYEGRKHTIGSDRFPILINSLRIIEKQIFEKVDISPEEITTDIVDNLAGELQSWSF